MSGEREDTRPIVVQAWLDGEVEAGEACRRLADADAGLLAEAVGQRRMHVLLHALLAGPSVERIAVVARQVAGSDSHSAKLKQARAIAMRATTGRSTRRLSVGAPRRQRRGRLGMWLGRIGLLAAVLLLVALPLLLSGQGTDPGLAKLITQAAGPDIEIQRGDRLLIGVSGMPLAAGDRIQLAASAEGGAEVRYPDQSVVTLLPATAARIWEEAGAKRIQLDRGEIRCDVAKQPVGKSLRIRSAQAEAEVVGTRFSLRVAEGRTRLDVAEGLVRITQRIDGVVSEIAAGHAFETAPQAVGGAQVDAIGHGQELDAGMVGRAGAVALGLTGLGGLENIAGDQVYRGDVTLRNKRFTGKVEVVGGKVTFEFCSFTWAPPAHASQLRQYNEGREAGQVVCNWCDFDPGLRGGHGVDRTSNAMFGERGSENPETVGSTFVLYRCRLNGCGSGVSINRYRSSGSSISECMISQLTTGGGNHSYGIQMLSSDHIEVLRSRIELGRLDHSCIAIMPDFGEIPEAKPLLIQDCYLSGGRIPLLVTRYDEADREGRGGRFIENVRFIGNHFGDASQWGRLCNFHHLNATFDSDYARNHPRTLYWARSNVWAPDGEGVSNPERAPSGDAPGGLPHVPGGFVDERSFFGGQHWVWNGKVLP